MNRRKAIGTLATVPLVSQVKATFSDTKRLKIMITGGHPDDPETGCGGAAAKWAKQGHEIVFVYLTKGEAGIPGTSHAKAAEIRTNEALNACKIINARPIFLGQVDGDSEINNAWYKKTLDLLTGEKPDVLLTHWMTDTHRDHRVCANLFYDAWLNSGRQSALYFYEVLTGGQTQNFNPTDYVDITQVVDIKHESCLAHKSQLTKESYDSHHGRMERFRGMEATVPLAEGYARHWQSKISELFSQERS